MDPSERPALAICTVQRKRRHQLVRVLNRNRISVPIVAAALLKSMDSRSINAATRTGVVI